jgi:methyl-accepting chemotaxis protein
VHEDELCVLKIGRTAQRETEVRRFADRTFEAALRQAAAAGTLKSDSLEKQIAFLARSLPDRCSDAEDGGLVEAPAASRFLAETLFPATTSVISALVHETQRERGTSSLYASSAGQLFASELRGQWRTTDDRRADLVLFRQRHGSRLPPQQMLHLDRAERLIGDLIEGRGKVESLEMTPAQIIDSYSAANRELLSVIDGLAAATVETALRPTALAWMALLYAKEKTGIERAQLASAFTRDRYTDGQHAMVSALIASSDSYLHLFSAAAPISVGELLRQSLKSEAVGAVTEMERVALGRSEGGFGIDPTAWFANVSRKMDLLGDVESAVRASLTRGQV